MKQIHCENCGADVFEIKSNYKICKYCNTKYQLEVFDYPKYNSNISVKSDVEILLERCKSEPEKARKYANLVLDIDPTNKDAKKYL